MIRDEKITRAIFETHMEAFLDYTEVDVALAGAGPANLIAGKKLAEEDVKTVIFEENLSVGGGMWGGGMMFPRIVVQEKAKEILEEVDIDYQEYEKGYYVASSIEAVSRLTSEAVKAGAEIFNCVYVEDVMINKKEQVSGLVVNWNPVKEAGLHVDPVGVKSKVAIDGTGHDAELCRFVQEKIPEVELEVKGEKPMYANRGEKAVVEVTGEVYPNLIADGMAASNVFGESRMGPVFGGMLLSGNKAAKIASKKLK